MATDTNISQLVINKLTQAQYDAAKEAGQIVETELYMVTDGQDESLVSAEQVIVPADTAASLGLTDATVNGALEKLSESLAVKETQVQVKTAGVDWEFGTFTENSNYYYTTGFAEAGNGAIVRSSGSVNYSMKSMDGGKTWTIFNHSVNSLKLCSCNGYLIRTLNYNLNTFDLYNPETDSWTTRTATLPYSINWGPAAYGNGRYVIMNRDNSTKAAWCDTVNGTYTAVTLPVAASWEKVIFANNMFVAVGYNSSKYYVIRSTDGKTWEKCTTPTMAGMPNSLVYGNGMFLITASTTALYSYDGVNWQSYTLPNWGYVAFGGGKFYLQGMSTSSNPNGHFSVDGLNWTPTNKYTIYDIGALEYIQDKFWVVGRSTSTSDQNYYITYDEYEPMYRLVTPDSTDETEKVAEALGGVKIETGTYTGTGTYGESNQNSLTFGFEPKAIFVTTAPFSSSNIYPIMACLIIPAAGAYACIYYDASVGYTGGSGNTNTASMKWATGSISADQTSASWYSNSSDAGQLNKSGTTYHYIAIG